MLGYAQRVVLLRETRKRCGEYLGERYSSWDRKNVNTHLAESRPDRNRYGKDREGSICVQGYGVQYIRGSVGESFLTCQVSGLGVKFRGLTSAARYFSEDNSVSGMIWAPVGFAAWYCTAEENKVGNY